MARWRSSSPPTLGRASCATASSAGRTSCGNRKKALGKSGEPKWVARGGHRIWVGPEDVNYTYPPDNGPARIEIKGGVLVATQPVEKETGIEKQIEVRMDAGGSGVTITHRLKNTGVMPLEFAAWALVHDGARRSGRDRIPAARHASGDAAAHQPAGHVGVFGPERSALEVHQEVPDPATGPGQRQSSKARPPQSRRPGAPISSATRLSSSNTSPARSRTIPTTALRIRHLRTPTSSRSKRWGR